MNIELSIEEEFNFRTTPYRWFIMIMYTLHLIGYCIVMMSFSSISVTVAQIYEVDTITVNIAYTFFLVNAFVLNFPATYAIEKYGIKKTFKISSLVSILGVWIRYLTVQQTHKFLWILPGTAMVAVCQPFIYVSISKVATRWFPDSERGRATTIMGLADPIGCIIGIAIGPFVIFDDDVKDHDLGRQHTEKLLMI